MSAVQAVRSRAADELFLAHPPRYVPEPYLLTTATYPAARPLDEPAQLLEEHDIIWCGRGSVTVEAGGRSWVLPAGSGLWVPAGVIHHMRGGAGTFAGRTFVDPRRVSAAPERPRLVAANAALRELLVHLAVTPMDEDERVRAQRVCLDLLVPLAAPYLEVPRPSDPRIAAIGDRVLDVPSDERSLEQWALQLRFSTRTLSRAFVDDVGMGFSLWRAHVRVRAAVGLLAEGASVGEAARLVGYRNVSAFVAAFRRVTGRTPGSMRDGDGVAPANAR